MVSSVTLQTLWLVFAKFGQCHASVIRYARLDVLVSLFLELFSFQLCGTKGSFNPLQRQERAESPGTA